MRTLITICLLAGLATAWEAVPGPICVLSHEEDDSKVRVTYDPTGPLYSVTVSGSEPWANAPVLGITFDGPFGLTITTNRHQIDGASLTVSDCGCW